MFAFGVVYAIASIGCTIGLLTTAILGSFTRDGVVSGVLSVMMYGIGMALFVTALTTTLAFAKTALVRGGRGVMSVVSYLSSGLVLITGVYLTWYWFAAITQRSSAGGFVSTVERWQSRIVQMLQDVGAIRLAIVFVVVIVAAIVVTRRRPAANRS